MANDIDKEINERINFDDELDALIKKEIDRRVKADFIENLCGDWSREEIHGILKNIREKLNDESGADLLLLYLFAEILEEGKLILTWDDKRINFKEVICEENKVVVCARRGSLEIELKDGTK